MKRVGVIYPLSLDPARLAASDPEVQAAIEQNMEDTRQNLAKTFPGVRFMVTLYGAAPVAFEFDDADEPLVDRKLPRPDFASMS